METTDETRWGLGRHLLLLFIKKNRKTISIKIARISYKFDFLKVPNPLYTLSLASVQTDHPYHSCCTSFPSPSNPHTRQFQPATASIHHSESLGKRKPANTGRFSRPTMANMDVVFETVSVEQVTSLWPVPRVFIWPAHAKTTQTLAPTACYPNMEIIHAVPSPVERLFSRARQEQHIWHHVVLMWKDSRTIPTQTADPSHTDKVNRS